MCSVNLVLWVDFNVIIENNKNLGNSIWKDSHEEKIQREDSTESCKTEIS